MSIKFNFKAICFILFLFVFAGCGTTPVASSDDADTNDRKANAIIPMNGTTANIEFEAKVDAKKLLINNNSSLDGKPYEGLPFGGYQRVPSVNNDLIFIDSLSRLVETNKSGFFDEVVINVMDVDSYQSVAVSDWILFVGVAVASSVQRTLSCTATVNFKIGEKAIRHNLVAFVPKFPVKSLAEVDKDAISSVNGRMLSGVGDCYAVLTEQVAKVINNQAVRAKAIPLAH